jgi:hypothetical protein
MPKDEQVAVRYPTGFRRTNNDGEELFMLLISNLYGYLAEGRYWEKERNRVRLKEFNQDGYTIKSCIENCMFFICKG